MAIRWRSWGLALGLVMVMPAGVAAVPLSSGVGAIGAAAETTSDIVLVKKGGKSKHAGGHRVKVKHAKVRHFKVKRVARHRWHHRRTIAPSYARAHWHCHVHTTARGALRHCHWHRHPHH